LGACRDELRPGLARDAACAPVMRQVEPPLQLSPRRSPLAGPAQRRTVVGERPGQLDRRLGAPEYRDRLAEQVEAAVAALDQARGAQCDTQRSRPPETACHLDRRPGKPPGPSPVAEQA